MLHDWIFVINWGMVIWGWVDSLGTSLVEWYMLHREYLQRYSVGILVFYLWHTCWDLFEEFVWIWMRNGLVSLGIFLEVLLLYSTCFGEWLCGRSGEVHCWCILFNLLSYLVVHCERHWLVVWIHDWFTSDTCLRVWSCSLDLIWIVEIGWDDRLLWQVLLCIVDALVLI